MKYIDGSGKVRTLITERHPFKGVENYFTDSLLYQDSVETDEISQPEEPDSGNEADTESEKEECMWELDPLVTSTNKLDVDNTADDVGGWYLNEDLDLAYLSVFASDSVPSDTSTEVDDDLWSAMDALTSLHVPVKSSFETYRDAGNAQESIFMVPARRKGQKLILFGRITSTPMSREESGGEEEPPQFGHYEPNTLRMMKSMGYDLTSRPGLNFGKGRRTLLRSFVPKGKTLDYYHRTRRGLGYVSTPSHQPLTLESHWAMIAHRARPRGCQMLVSATSSEISQ